MSESLGCSLETALIIILPTFFAPISYSVGSKQSVGLVPFHDFQRKPRSLRLLVAALLWLKVISHCQNLDGYQSKPISQSFIDRYSRGLKICNWPTKLLWENVNMPSVIKKWFVYNGAKMESVYLLFHMDLFEALKQCVFAKAQWNSKQVHPVIDHDDGHGT